MKDFNEEIRANRDAVITDAVELGKDNFVNLYVDRGFDKFNVGRAWHDLRRTNKGQQMIAQIYGQRSGYRESVAYEVLDSEFEKQIEDRKKIKEIKKKVKENSTNIEGTQTIAAPKVAKVKKVSRLAQVRKLYESGMTSSKAIAEELGTNASYVQRLIKQIK